MQTANVDGVNIMFSDEIICLDYPHYWSESTPAGVSWPNFLRSSARVLCLSSGSLWIGGFKIWSQGQFRVLK